MSRTAPPLRTPVLILWLCRWSVVASGAVISVLRNTFSSKDFAGSQDPKRSWALYQLPEVSARISRFNYRVENGVPVYRAVPPVDVSRDQVTTDCDGTKLVWRMRWYLRQVSISTYASLPTTRHPTELADRVITRETPSMIGTLLRTTSRNMSKTPPPPRHTSTSW